MARMDLRGTASLNEKPFQRALRSISRGIRNVARNTGLVRLAASARQVGLALGGVARQAATVVAPLVGLAAAGGVAGLLVLAKYYADATDEGAKFSRQIGFTLQSWRELSFVAERQGVSTSTLSSSMRAFTKRLGEAKNGTGALVTYLKKSNPQLLKQLIAAKDNEQAFGLLLGAIAKIKDPTERAALASAAFSRAGMDLARIAEAGADGISTLRAEARRLLGTLSELDGSNAEAFNDSLTNLSYALTGLRDGIAKEIVPVLTPFINQIADWVAANREVIATGVADVVTDLAEALKSVDWVEAFKGLHETMVGLSGFVDQIGGLNTVLIGLAGLTFAPFIAAVFQVVAALLSLGAAILTTPIGWLLIATGVVAAGIMRKWEEVKAAVARIFSGIHDTFAGLTQWLRGVFTGDFAGAVDGLKSIVTGIHSVFQGLSDLVASVLIGIATVVRDALADVVNYIDATFGTNLMSSMKAIWTDVSTSVASFAQGFFDQVVGAWKKVEQWFAAITWPSLPEFAELTGLETAIGRLSSAFDGIAEAWNAALEAAKQGLLAFVNWFRSTFIDPIVSAIERVKSAFNSIANFKLPSFSASAAKAEAANGPNPGGSFTKYAKGGKFFAGQPMIVGERGEEAIMPLVPGVVINAETLRAAFSGFSPGRGGGKSPGLPAGALRSAFAGRREAGVPTGGGLLERAIRAGAVGGGSAEAQIKRVLATLEIKLSGAPKGTRMAYAESEPLFGAPLLKTGRAMV